MIHLMLSSLEKTVLYLKKERKKKKNPDFSKCPQTFEQ